MGEDVRSYLFFRRESFNDMGKLSRLPLGRLPLPNIETIDW
jgi:hypothetical protein